MAPGYMPSLPNPKVLEDIPMNIPVAKEIYAFYIPTDKPVGVNEHDCSNVTVKLFDPNGEELPLLEGQVGYFSVGKLGALKGGLLNLKDQRKVLDKEGILVLREQEVDAKIDERRTVPEEKPKTSRIVEYGYGVWVKRDCRIAVGIVWFFD